MAYQELRQNPITGNWVIIAEDRGKRPGVLQINGKKQLPAYDKDCVFCPGNEDKTPPEILAYRNGDVWWARTIPNKFPALSLEARIDGQPQMVREGMFVRMPGYGVHEVIIETPSHNQDIYDRELGQVREMLWMYRDRLTKYKNEEGLENILIFKNKGDTAAASLDHPHSQLTASPVHMQRLDLEIEGSQRYFLSENFMGKKEQCGYCDMINQEIEIKDKFGVASSVSRVIAENPYSIAFLPFASAFPFETWIMPKNHRSDYTLINPEEATQLAIITKEVFEKLHSALPNFDYNMILHTTPLNADIQKHYHWHFEIIPKLTKIGGFELGSGIFINIVAPEKAAKFMNTGLDY